MVEQINLDIWTALQKTTRCWSCNAKIAPFIEYKSSGGKYLNPEFLIHQYMTHGMPVEIIIENIAGKLYKTDEAKTKMINFYKKIICF